MFIWFNSLLLNIYIVCLINLTNIFVIQCYMVHMASVWPSFCPELPLLFHWASTTSDWAVLPPRPGVRQPMAVVLQSEINNTHRYYATIFTFFSVSVWQGWGITENGPYITNSILILSRTLRHRDQLCNVWSNTLHQWRF